MSGIWTFAFVLEIMEYYFIELRFLTPGLASLESGVVWRDWSVSVLQIAKFRGTCRLVNGFFSMHVRTLKVAIAIRHVGNHFCREYMDMMIKMRRGDPFRRNALTAEQKQLEEHFYISTSLASIRRSLKELKLSTTGNKMQMARRLAIAMTTSECLSDCMSAR